MSRVRVDLGSRGYDVVVAPGSLREVASALAGRRRAAVVTQPAVARHHLDAVRDALADAIVEHDVFLIDEGETAKALTTVERLARGFARWGLRRDDAVVALGGGVVGDTAGFAAAVYLRGVACVQVPTTLLAMVDSAVGGKTAVNLPEGKNLVGAFHQPVAVIADTETLATLPEEEYRSGLGEVVKYALMGHDDLGVIVAERPDALVARTPDVLADVVGHSVALKAAVVAADEREETGARAVLNYGHTLAHALEAAGGYGLRHGEAVAVGLVFAAELAAALGRVGDAEVQRHRATVAAVGLPTVAPDGASATDLVELMRRDKKSTGGLTFVLAGPAGLEVVADPDPAAVDAALRAIGVRR